MKSGLKTTTLRRQLWLGLVMGLTHSLCSAQSSASPSANEYPDPTRFEEAIKAFKVQDQTNPPPGNAIVCIGSSSMRLWHDTIHEDLAPLTIIARGFGGSTMHDASHYADRIVIPYKPRAIVLYEGDNDVAEGVRPETIRDTFLEFMAKVHKSRSGIRIYVLSIKPSIQRWSMWPDMQEANRLLAEHCAGDDRLTYVDIASPMLDSSGQVRTDIFVDDDLHMNAKGYALWRDVLRPILLKAEGSFESTAQSVPATQSPSSEP